MPDRPPFGFSGGQTPSQSTPHLYGFESPASYSDRPGYPPREPGYHGNPHRGHGHRGDRGGNRGGNRGYDGKGRPQTPGSHAGRRNNRGRGGGNRGNRGGQANNIGDAGLILPDLPIHPPVPVISFNTQDVSPEQLIVTSKADNIKDKSAANARSLTEHMFNRGLRTEFGTSGEPKEVLTNFFKITHRPAFLFVYKLTFVRRWYKDDDGVDKAVYVKNKVEKRALFDQMKNRPALADLVDEAFWVTDYDMIWSTKRLFNGQEFDIPEIQVFNLTAMNPTTTKSINTSDAYVEFDRVIHLNKSIGEMFHYSTGGVKGDEDAAILVRGLNAIATRHAQSQASSNGNDLISAGANKFYRPGSSHFLSNTLKALDGFAASVRPGAQNLLLNISLKCSPFLKAMTVYAYMQNRYFPDSGPLAAALKGVQVQILDVIKPNLSEGQRMRVITGIGGTLDMQELNDADKRLGITTVWDYYRHVLPLADDDKTKNSYAINVGGRPKKKGDTSKQHENPDDPEWYPPQFLRIVGHPLFHDKLATSQVAKMITHALKVPSMQVAEITGQGMEMFGINNDNFQTNLRNHFGMEIETELYKVPSRLLKCPTVLYAESVQAQVSKATWNLKEIHLIKPCDTEQVLILDLTGLRASQPKDKKNRTSVSKDPSLAGSSLAADSPKVSVTAQSKHIDNSVEDDDDDEENTGPLTPLNPKFPSMLENAMQSMGLYRCTVKGPIPPTPIIDALGNVSESMEIDESKLKEVFEWVIQSHAPKTDMRKVTVVVVIPKQSPALYTTIKRVAELKMGLKTVCCVASKFASKVDISYCANIVLKLNIKGESDNHHIHKSWFTKLYSEDPRSADSGTFIANTIVIGADVTHPMGHCAPGCPSIAAVVGSTDNHFAQFPGSMRLQRSRKETIVDLQHMVKERLIDWADCHNGRLPYSVLFYRDGVSESQYEEVRKMEIPAVKEAFILAANYLERRVRTEQEDVSKPKLADADYIDDGSTVMRDEKDPSFAVEEVDKTTKRGCPPFSLTFVVVGKRHNTRFYAYNAPPPKDETSSQDDEVLKEQTAKQRPTPVSYANATPGSVIDQGITHPYLFDFYLQSHFPMKGTGRSAHYVVLQNNMKLSADELQNITHGFCYNYARATRGVSYCAPAYYADRLCDRGRFYIRHWLTHGDNNHADRSRDKNETAEEFNDYVKDFLHDTSYYRPLQDTTRQNPWHANLDKTMFYL